MLSDVVIILLFVIIVENSLLQPWQGKLMRYQWNTQLISDAHNYIYIDVQNEHGSIKDMLGVFIRKCWTLSLSVELGVSKFASLVP